MSLPQDIHPACNDFNPIQWEPSTLGLYSSDTGQAPFKGDAPCSHGAISSIKDTYHLTQLSWAPNSHKAAAQQWTQAIQPAISDCMSPLQTGPWPH